MFFVPSRLGTRRQGRDRRTRLSAIFYWEGNQRKVILNPRYTWDLGEPVESHSPDHLDQYKSAGHQTYVRKFQKGIVLVNPSTTRDEDVTLSREYVDPETEQRVTAVSLEPQTGKILLIPVGP